MSTSTVQSCARLVTHVVLDVRPAAAGEEDPAGLVVAVLTGHVEGREPGPVLHVDIGPAGAEERQALTEPVLGRHVESRVPLQLVLLEEEEVGGLVMFPQVAALQDGRIVREDIHNVLLQWRHSRGFDRGAIQVSIGLKPIKL